MSNPPRHYITRIHLPYELVTAALSRMTEADRMEMLRLADDLVIRIKDRNPRVAFSRFQALELLAAIGFDMVRPGIHAKEQTKIETYLRGVK
jgi:hypothetical protein